jgi:predicted nucleic acid-binding protein
MAKAVSNTSPLLYLYRIDVVDWLPKLFTEIWTPGAVVTEFEEGQRRGYDVPNPRDYEWLKIIDPRSTPSEWLALDLGKGKLAAMALALENPERTILLDDELARRTAKAAGLNVRGALGILLDAKSQGLTERVEPLIERLEHSGMWLSPDVRDRILILAGEKAT